MADMMYNNTEYLVDKYLNEILRLSLMYVRNMEDAEDVSQQVFITYIKRKPTFDSEQHAKNWLFKVAVNLSKNHLRSRHSNVNFDDLENVLSTDDTKYIQSDSELAVARAVLRLKREHREVIHLYYYEGFDTNQIAKILSITPSGARSRLARARDALEILLKGDESIVKRLQPSNEPCVSE